MGVETTSGIVFLKSNIYVCIVETALSEKVGWNSSHGRACSCSGEGWRVDYRLKAQKDNKALSGGFFISPPVNSDFRSEREGGLSSLTASRETCCGSLTASK